jgi:hypothetical protein
MTNKMGYLNNANLTIVAAVLLAAALIIGGVPTLVKVYQANAQMMSSNIGKIRIAGTGGAQNQTMAPMMMYNPPPANITSSIPISPTISKAITSQVHINLVNATMTAEKTVGGNNTHAVSAHLGVQNGFLVYSVLVIDAKNNFHNVVVDPGNGKVLLDQQIRPGMMMQPGMFGPGPGPGMMMQPGMFGPGPGMMMQGGSGMMFPPPVSVPVSP